MPCARLVLALMIGGLGSALGQGGETSAELAVKYILATVKAFRTVYSHGIVQQVKKAGVQPKENWMEDDHAIMLPFQLVKLAGLEIKGEFKDVEVGIVSLTPIYTSNFPQTPAEANALKRMAADPTHKVVTFADGNQFKGLAADFAIEQTCVDCHNHHPSSTRRDFKKGDLMGALVVRLRQ